MISTLKAEFRKLLSVRSTYVATGLAVALVIFYAFYIIGYRKNGANLHDPAQLSSDITGAVNAVSIFASVVAILLMTHEYRYNTIIYTLTTARNRNTVLLAKIASIVTYSVLFTLFCAVLSPLMALLGMHAHHFTLAHQTIYYGSLLWRVLVFGVGNALAALLFAALIRNQVGALAAIFIVPGIVEQLLSLLLKNNAVYLPFTALSAVIGSQQGDLVGKISAARAAGVFAAYLVVGWIVTWVLFLKRDATA